MALESQLKGADLSPVTLSDLNASIHSADSVDSGIFADATRFILSHDVEALLKKGCAILGF